MMKSFPSRPGRLVKVDDDGGGGTRQWCKHGATVNIFTIFYFIFFMFFFHFSLVVGAGGGTPFVSIILLCVTRKVVVMGVVGVLSQTWAQKDTTHSQWYNDTAGTISLCYLT